MTLAKKLAWLVFAAVYPASSWAQDKPKDAATVTVKPLADADARSVRELQLSITQAQLAMIQAQVQYNESKAALDKLQPQVQAKVEALQKQYECSGCLLDNDLKWVQPASQTPPEAKK
jgi:succinate dehydrogenase/fumarate reductase-like Fe-S protein